MYPTNYYGNRKVILSLCACVNNKWTPDLYKTGHRAYLKKVARFYGWTNRYHYIWAEDKALRKHLAPIIFNKEKLPSHSGKTSTGKVTGWPTIIAENGLKDHFLNSFNSLTSYKPSATEWVFLSLSVVLIGALITLTKFESLLPVITQLQP